MSLIVRFINRQAMTLDMEWMDHQMNNKLTISPQLPQRWITEITPDGAVRHIQRLTPEHLVISLHDIPSLLADRTLIDDAMAQRAADVLLVRLAV